jgi:uncharacterized protein
MQDKNENDMNMRNSAKTQGEGEVLLGSILKMWRYPVKSMLGEQCESVELNMRGVKGDRIFAIRDANGKFGSGKTTRRFRKIDGLFNFHAAYQVGVPEILFPDGRSMLGNNPHIHAALSETLGQAVTLAQEADISHLDAKPVHLLTTASLRWLKNRLTESQIDERRFRPNFLIDVPGETQVEQDWVGKILCVGNEVRLRVTELTERCRMVGLAQDDLPDDSLVLNSITRDGYPHFGVYAEVLAPGRIMQNDSVIAFK